MKDNDFVMFGMLDYYYSVKKLILIIASVGFVFPQKASVERKIESKRSAYPKRTVKLQTICIDKQKMR